MIHWGRKYVPSRRLHTLNSQGDRPARWLRDFVRHDTAAESLVLEASGNATCLGVDYRLSDGTGTVLEAFTPTSPIPEVASRHPELRDWLQTALARYPVDHAYVSTLQGFSLDLFDLGMPVTQVHLDHFPWCPAVYLYRSGPCHRCGDTELATCHQDNPVRRPLQPPGAYTQLRDDYFTCATRPQVVHVAPSRCVVETLCSMDPRFRTLAFRVVEPGLAVPRRDCFGGAEPERRLRIVVPGRLDAASGLGLLSACFERLRLFADLMLVGCGEAGRLFEHRWGIAVEEGGGDDLATAMAAFAPDLALCLSVAPPTYDYDLAEARILGVPPAATAVGSHTEQIEPERDGFLFVPNADDLVDLVVRLDTHREMLRTMAARLRNAPLRSSADMVRAFCELRRPPSPTGPTLVLPASPSGDVA